MDQITLTVSDQAANPEACLRQSHSDLHSTSGQNEKQISQAARRQAA